MIFRELVQCGVVGLVKASLELKFRSCVKQVDFRVYDQGLGVTFSKRSFLPLCVIASSIILVQGLPMNELFCLIRM